jgi:hypothetical protein
LKKREAVVAAFFSNVTFFSNERLSDFKLFDVARFEILPRMKYCGDRNFGLCVRAHNKPNSVPILFQIRSH